MTTLHRLDETRGTTHLVLAAGDVAESTKAASRIGAGAWGEIQPIPLL